MSRLLVAIVIALTAVEPSKPLALDIAANAEPAERPLIAAQDQGEVRVWRPVVSESLREQKLDKATHFFIKVDTQHGGSPDFWFGTETLPSGAGIPYHRHLHEDEVLYIFSGSAHVNVGSLHGDAHPGAIIFIPRDTWVSLQPIGKKPISLLFAFNAPGFDRYMRCESVPLGQQGQPVTLEEDRHCTKMGDVEYR